jgi:hypothetical protein
MVFNNGGNVMNYLFVLPINDGESYVIAELLKQSNVPFLVTNQKWGASWQGLESDIINKVINAINNGVEVFGIELQGYIDGVKNIDHHNYSWLNDDRSHDLSSLEQVAKLLKIKLTPFQKAVSENDKGYIPLMQKNKRSKKMIEEVRALDRKSQGISEEAEKEAERAISNLSILNDLTIIQCGHSKCAPITDRLYGKYKNLFIISPGELNFFGSASVVKKLEVNFSGWSGGSGDNKFWGINEGANKTNYTINDIIKNVLNWFK